MALTLLRVRHLRCLESVELELDPAWNLILGPNGAGKTSLLEAVHVVGRGRSFRTRQNRRLIQRGQDNFSIYAELLDGQRRRRIGIVAARGSLELRLDGAPARRATELDEVLPVNVLDPGSHALIDAGPSERRRYLDWGVFHVEHDYLTNWRRYRRTLGQRNAALKQGVSGAALDVWSDRLVDAGLYVDAARRRYITELTGRVESIGKRLLGGQLNLEYRPGWPLEESFVGAVTRSASRDTETRLTQVGPHRADLSIRLDGAQVREAASRGQQKLIAAALVLGQVETFAAARRDAGVLLVDDPAAELDRAALGRLMTELDRLRVQRILTSLDSRPPAPLPAARVFHVEQGSIKRVYNSAV